MVISMWGPRRAALDEVRLYEAILERARRLRTDSGYFGRFDLWVPNIGLFRECRLVQYRRGGFFTSGEHRVNMTGRRYMKFFEFLDPFSTWLALQARAEVMHDVREREGELLTETDEILVLDENERLCRCEPRRLSADEAIILEPARRAPHERRPSFHAVLGGSIRVRELRVVGNERNARLVAPTSDGLQERPVEIESWLAQKIVRRYLALKRGPKPFAGWSEYRRSSN